MFVRSALEKNPTTNKGFLWPLHYRNFKKTGLEKQDLCIRSPTPTANLNMISFVIGTGVASLAAGSWSKLSDGPWTAREGLMAVSNGESIFMSGGRYSNIYSLAAHLHYYLADGYAPRTRDGLGFGSDVWKTENGTHWTEVQQTAFPKRVPPVEKLRIVRYEGSAYSIL
jgi:hypothetical protein